MSNQKTILVVDDESINRSILTNIFCPIFDVRVCKSGEEALRLLRLNLKPDLILLDIMMPGLDGYETLARILNDPEVKDIPVIFITALDSDLDEDKGFHLGAVDYITKPFKPVIVMARVSAHIELKQARDRLRDQNHWLETEIRKRIAENQVIQDAALIALTQLAETRDDSTGNHIVRTSKYIEVLARKLQEIHQFTPVLSEDAINRIVKAAALHDIGKIGIPDAILLKRGALTNDEFNIIKTHCQIGSNALRTAINKVLESSSVKNLTGNTNSLLFLEEAEIIAEYHHEKWDGTGYPKGLRGEEIPLSARLMALADVFDALTIERPYKKAWSFDKAVDYIISQKGTQFDPVIVDVFIAEVETFENLLKKTAS